MMLNTRMCGKPARNTHHWMLSMEMKSRFWKEKNRLTVCHSDFLSLVKPSHLPWFLFSHAATPVATNPNRRKHNFDLHNTVCRSFQNPPLAQPDLGNRERITSIGRILFGSTGRHSRDPYQNIPLIFYWDCLSTWPLGEREGRVGGGEWCGEDQRVKLLDRLTKTLVYL